MLMSPAVHASRCSVLRSCSRSVRCSSSSFSVRGCRSATNLNTNREARTEKRERHRVFLPHRLERFERRLAYAQAAVLLAQPLDRRLQGRVVEGRRRAQAADYHVGHRILVFVLPYVALDGLLDEGTV